MLLQDLIMPYAPHATAKMISGTNIPTDDVTMDYSSTTFLEGTLELSMSNIPTKSPTWSECMCIRNQHHPVNILNASPHQ